MIGAVPRRRGAGLVINEVGLGIDVVVRRTEDDEKRNEALAEDVNVEAEAEINETKTGNCRLLLFLFFYDV